MIKKIKGLTKKIVQAFFWFFPINRRKILISSYCGKGYGDNLKYIVEELLSRDIPSLKIIWLVKTKEEAKSLPNKVTPCKKGSLKEFYHTATAGIWIDNCRKIFTYKKKKQFYMQTWHGFALKRIEKDVENHLDLCYVELARKDSKAINVIISCSTFMENIYKNCFWYDGEVLTFGAPRNDIIIHQNKSVIRKVKEAFSLEEDTKIILYAPTFRRYHSLEPYSVDYERLIQSCEERFGGNFIVLVRLHPNIMYLAKDIGYNEKIINASAYPDMQELLVATDVLISDYSSLMFDYALSKKPVFLFATDIEEYKDDRNFYFEIDKLPFILSQNNDELKNAILNFDEEHYTQSLTKFYETVGMDMSGLASRRCVDLLIEKMK